MYVERNWQAARHVEDSLVVRWTLPKLKANKQGKKLFVAAVIDEWDTETVRRNRQTSSVQPLHLFPTGSAFVIIWTS
jgi:hypothetical protein